jgi:hypothetical protein
MLNSFIGEKFFALSYNPGSSRFQGTEDREEDEQASPKR